MYEYEKVQQAAAAAVMQQKNWSSGAIGSISIPQYGGDCALKQDGLSSSVKRLSEIAANLNQVSWQLRGFFGMDVPETNSSAPCPSGHKGDIDQVVILARAALDNITLVLEHLRS